MIGCHSDRHSDRQDIYDHFILQLESDSFMKSDDVDSLKEIVPNVLHYDQLSADIKGLDVNISAQSTRLGDIGQSIGTLSYRHLSVHRVLSMSFTCLTGSGRSATAIANEYEDLQKKQ